MPCNYSIESEGRLVLEHWYGSVTPEQILAQKDALLLESDIEPGATVFSDCREAEFMVSGDSVLEFARAEAEAAPDSRIRRYGFLVRDDVFQQAQFFAEKIKELGVTAIVFNSFDVACKWTGLPAERVGEMLIALRDRRP